MNPRDCDAQLAAMGALTPLNMVDYARECCGIMKGVMMQRTLTITDYGKDHGFGRYVVVAENQIPSEDNESVNSNDPRDALDLVNRWMAEVIKKGENDGRNEVA